jgi:hypothetical protein
MVKRHRDLDDPLVKITRLTRLADPEILHGLVAFEPFPVVEFPYALKQLSRRGILAGPLHG